MTRLRAQIWPYSLHRVICLTWNIRRLLVKFPRYHVYEVSLSNWADPSFIETLGTQDLPSHQSVTSEEWVAQFPPSWEHLPYPRRGMTLSELAACSSPIPGFEDPKSPQDEQITTHDLS